MPNVKPNLEAHVLAAVERATTTGLRPSELTQQMQKVGSVADVRRVMERLIDRGKIEVGTDLKMRVPSRSHD